MNAIIFKRSVLAAIIGSSMAFGLSAPSTADARQPRDTQPQQSQERQDRQDKKEAEAKTAREAARQQQEVARAQRDRAQAQVQSRDANRRQAGQSPPRQMEPREQRVQPQQRLEQRDDRARAVAAQQANRNERMMEPPMGQARPESNLQQRRDDYGRDSVNNVQRRERDRLPEPQRQKLISQQRQQAEQFSRQDDSRRATAERYGRELQRQNRNSQYRYQQEYYDRMRRHNSRHDWRTYNYYNDPYFYTAPSYRYYRGGSYYSINMYGVNLLQQAINFGYSEGLRAGRADRMDRWRYDYRSSYAYRDANYGYYGFYVNQSEYNYYFRQGFERGYADGYYGRRQYGRYYNGADVLLAPVMSLIFNFQFYR